jgi:hypothetical protein
MMLHRLCSIQISDIKIPEQPVLCPPLTTIQHQRAFVQQSTCIHIKTGRVLNQGLGEAVQVLVEAVQVLEEAALLGMVYLVNPQEGVVVVLRVIHRDRRALLQASHITPVCAQFAARHVSRASFADAVIPIATVTPSHSIARSGQTIQMVR